MSGVADASPDTLVFLPLGGTGEIGMNLNLYGHAGQWLMVDLGITFPEDGMPGIELVLPDPTFIEERRDALLGLVLTHAHEDHLGAVPHLWRRLQCPIWATPFTAAVLRRKLEEHGLLDAVPLHEVPLGGRVGIGPFGVQFISLTHSIPEPNALALRTPAGTVLHTGDWKIDARPLVGGDIDEAALRALGDEGVLAMVCDSTNALNPGRSGSEAEVRESLLRLVEGRPGRVAVTSFASNVARISTVAAVARAHDRHLALVGRSLWRIVSSARDTGYLDDLGPVLEAEEAAYLPPDKVLYLCTGCQGEPRGAMARIAAGQHPHVVLGEGDTAIFSSKMIPGNERAIGRMLNRLSWHGVTVISERDAFVHVSGHPCRDELADMYRWVRPRIAVPVHGEYRHLVAHAELARELQVPAAVVMENGQMLRLGPGEPEIVGEVQAGRWLLDGEVVVPQEDEAIRTRRKIMYNGTAVITLVADPAGRLIGAPAVVMQGITADGQGTSLQVEALRAVQGAVASVPRDARGDDGRIAEAARLALRRLLRQRLGKRPVVEAQVIRVPQ
ncbi:MAG TPA: ribonuclease J [Alphaproteobacteria bacterium]|nr:ribonuclease J [Alphaproteobacteria bacterium]